jgi:hypothetical protein
MVQPVPFDAASVLTLTLLPRGAVADTLLHRRIHLFGRDQHDGLNADGSRRIDRQRNRTRGDTIGHVGDNEKIVTTVRIIKGLQPSPLLCHGFALKLAGASKRRGMPQKSVVSQFEIE